MNAFTFVNPTRIDFGSGVSRRAAAVCQELGARHVLLISGMGSARRSGLLDAVEESLRALGIPFTAHEGVRPNPVLGHVREGIAKARDCGADLVLAVGGGSVVDSAKAVAAGALADHDVWDFFEGGAPVSKALPLVAVLTLAATGSEMNGGSVVTREDTRNKTFFSSLHTHPRVSLLDPDLTLSLPWEQTANGLSDAFAHLLEPYLNTPLRRPIVQLELKEGLFRSLVDCGVRLKANPQDLEARGDFMWSATLALNGMTSAGAGPAPYPVHMVEHAISAVTDLAHGAGLSAIYAGWIRWRLEQPQAEDFAFHLERLGQKVFALPESCGVDVAVEALVAWYRQVGTPATLREAVVAKSQFPEIAFLAARQARAWGMGAYTEAAVMEILELAH